MTEKNDKTVAGEDALAEKKKGTEVEAETGWLWHLYLRLPSRSTGPFRYIRDFFTCLEFLTRIRVTKREEWFPDDFARSVPFFPWTGLVMGVLQWGALVVGLWLQLSGLLLGIFLTLTELFFLGTLMYDGFMDTCDGIFSGRTRARKLEIMQDSHVGANAVLGAVLLILGKVSLFAVLPVLGGGVALMTMYVLTRTLMTVYIRRVGGYVPARWLAPVPVACRPFGRHPNLRRRRSGVSAPLGSGCLGLPSPGLVGSEQPGRPDGRHFWLSDGAGGPALFRNPVQCGAKRPGTLSAIGEPDGGPACLGRQIKKRREEYAY